MRRARSNAADPPPLAQRGRPPSIPTGSGAGPPSSRAHRGFGAGASLDRRARSTSPRSGAATHDCQLSPTLRGVPHSRRRKDATLVETERWRVAQAPPQDRGRARAGGRRPTGRAAGWSTERSCSPLETRRPRSTAGAGRRPASRTGRASARGSSGWGGRGAGRSPGMAGCGRPRWQERRPAVRARAMPPPSRDRR